MRSNVALIAGVLLGATAGLACLFAMKTPDRIPHATVAVQTPSKRAAVSVAPPSRVARETAGTTPTTASAPKASSGQTTGAVTAAARPASATGKAGAKPALPRVGGPTFGSKSGASFAATVEPQIASAKDQRVAPVVDRVQSGLSGFNDGIDLAHPIAFARPVGRLPAHPAKGLQTPQ